MNFEDEVADLAAMPLFESSYLLAGHDNPQKVQRQLTDWVRAGKLVQLRRGLYTVAPAYRQEQPHSFLLANHIGRGSYVSLQTALSYYDLIPEHVAVVTSVTTGRPGKWQNLYGHFSYRRLQPALFFGFAYRQLTATQWGYVATPEKALLDLIYLTPGGDNPDYLQELRLQNLDQLSLERLRHYVERAAKPKLSRSLTLIATLAEQEQQAFVPL